MLRGRSGGRGHLRRLAARRFERTPREITETPPQPVTVREHITDSYANSVRARAALKRGARKYSRLDRMIRAPLGAVPVGTGPDARFSLLLP